MSAPDYNALVAAALASGKGHMTSDEVLDHAMGLAADAGWAPHQLHALTRRSVAKRLLYLARDDEYAVRAVSAQYDRKLRRMTRCYAWVGTTVPTVPEPPTPAEAERRPAAGRRGGNDLRAEMAQLAHMMTDLGQRMSQVMEKLR